MAATEVRYWHDLEVIENSVSRMDDILDKMYGETYGMHRHPIPCKDQLRALRVHAENLKGQIGRMLDVIDGIEDAFGIREEDVDGDTHLQA